MKTKTSLFFIITILVIVLDQITKNIVSLNMKVSQSIPLIKNVLHLTYIQNTGAAFGILQNTNTLLIFISLFVIGGILFYHDKIPKDKLNQVCFALILGGAIGNLIDRIKLGFVIDFIDFRIWPSFNLADSALTIGVIWLVFYYWRKE